MTITNYIKLEFPSYSANESFARAAAAGFAAQLDPTLEELGDIKTAVSEAVTNCIVHAYPDSIGKITMRLRILEGEKLEITVQDNGIGISKDDQKKIFDKFYRVSTGNLHDVKGFGLGLAYVKKMISAFDGQISVDSELGKGSTFIIRLPLIGNGNHKEEKADA